VAYGCCALAVRLPAVDVTLLSHWVPLTEQVGIPRMERMVGRDGARATVASAIHAPRLANRAFVRVKLNR